MLGAAAGGAAIVKDGPVAVCPAVVILTGPVLGYAVAAGTGTVTAVEVQDVAVAEMPLKLTVPELPRFAPAITIEMPGATLLIAAPAVER